MWPIAGNINLPRPVVLCNSFKIARACRLSGTRCSVRLVFLPFMRSAGTNHCALFSVNLFLRSGHRGFRQGAGICAAGVVESGVRRRADQRNRRSRKSLAHIGSFLQSPPGANRSGRAFKANFRSAAGLRSASPEAMANMNTRPAQLLGLCALSRSLPCSLNLAQRGEQVGRGNFAGRLGEPIRV